MRKKASKKQVRKPELPSTEYIEESNETTATETVTDILPDDANSEATEVIEDVEITEEIGEENLPVEEPASLPIPTPEHVEAKKVSLDDLTAIDPDLLTGEGNTKSSKKLARKAKKTTVNDVPPIMLDLKGKNTEITKRKRGGGFFFMFFAVILVLATVAVTIFYKSGIRDRLKSPLKLNNEYVDSAEFSFMYHYILIDNGVDIFASDTQEMLNAPSDDPNYATNRDYFLDLTARQMQITQILYDDAVKHGLSISSEHYKLAEAYIDWLKSKASELDVSLDTYIKGVFGSQVNQQVVMNTLAKMYFAEDYSSGAKLVELQATEAQAEEAYQADRNTYDVVDYKILRITYEQREEAFLNTANLHADEIIEGIGHDSSLFESVAAQYFSGEAAIILGQPDSTLQSNVRYTDFTHDEFRDWLFDPARTPGDAVKFFDNDGFPIILCFVSRERQSEPLRDVRFIKINRFAEDGTELHTVNEVQVLAQSIDEYVHDEQDMQEIENIYNDEILSGGITVTHSTDTYRDKYDGILAKWIFEDKRQANDKAQLATEDGMYIVYMVSISEKPEWYDRVNSFIRMRNYQAFINEMESEYTYEFLQNGLDKIQDVP